MRLRALAFYLFSGSVTAFVAGDASAVCNPSLTYKRVVGDTASDKNCTDNDIQSAINNATCPNTTIFITGEHLYRSQHLLIQGQSLSLVGTSAANCSLSIGGQRPAEVDDTSLITISGAGHTGDSVVSIHGNSNVTLQNLEITAGTSKSDQFGG